MKKFDFTKSEYEFYTRECCFTKEEKAVLKLRRNEKSLVEISLDLNLALRTVSRRVKNISSKISNCLPINMTKG